nr:MAG TPA: hypothetical protein [Caudoviricetes sp.]
MSDFKNKDNQLIIMDFSKEPIISNSVAPYSFEISGKSFTVHSWVCCINKILKNPVFNDTGCRFIQFFQFFYRMLGKFHLVHQMPSSFQTSV